MLYLVASSYKIPVIVAEHCPFPLPGTSISIALKNAIEKANAVISPSNHVSRMILTQNISCKPLVVGNMVDESCFLPCLEKDYDRPFTILIVGSDNFYKDYHTFFEAMSILKKISKRYFRIMIVGINAEKRSNMIDYRNRLVSAGIQEISDIYPFVSRGEMINFY